MRQVVVGLLAAGLLAVPCLASEPAEGLGFGALARPLSADLQRPPAPAPHLSLEFTAPALALMGAGAVLGAAVEGITGSEKVGISISARPDR